MNFSNYRFTLDIQKAKTQASIPVHFRDTGNRFYISLTDGGNPYIISDGCHVDIYIKKPNGVPLINSCIIENNSLVRYDFNKDTASVEGIHNCELRLYSSDGRLITTPSFVMVVDQRVFYDDEIGTEEDMQTLLALDVIAKEEERRTAEFERWEAEELRALAEKNRVAAEESRGEAENERKEAEAARVLAENARVEAENERGQELATIKQYVEENIPDHSERIATSEGKITEHSTQISNHEERIISNEDSIWYNTEQLSSHESSINAHSTQISNHDERITGIERYLGGDNFIVDDSIAYEKTVPKNACEKAKVLSIGGMTYKKRKDEGNLMPYPYVGIGGLGYTVDKGAVTITSGDNDPVDFIISANDITVYPAGTYIFEVGEQRSDEVINVDLQFYGTAPTVLHLSNSKCHISAVSSFIVSRYIAVIEAEVTAVTLYPMFYKSDAPITWQPRGYWLSNTKVAAIESKGVNLWNPYVTDITAPGWVDAKNVPIELAENVWYQGLAGSGYWDSRNISNVQISNNKISFLTNLSGYGMTRVFKCKPNTAYTFSCDYEGDLPIGCSAGFYDKNGNWFEYNWNAKDIVTPDNCYWLTICLTSDGAPSNCTFSNIMFAESDVEIPYTPYVGTIDTFAIPEVVQGREGYGLGLEGMPNTIIYENGLWIFNKPTKKFTVTSAAYVGWANEGYKNIDFYAFKLPTDYVSYKLDAFIMEGFKNTTSSNWDSSEFYGAVSGRATEFEIWAGFPKGTPQEEAIAQLVGKNVVYALVTPEIEDITELMPKENLIKVLGGCKIAAVNEQSDPVQFSIKYLVSYPKEAK